MAWVAVVALAVGVRVWNALRGAALWGDDAWGHVSYMLFLDTFGGVPWADQGWSYFHPPLHYVLGWGLASLGSGETLIRGTALWGGLASLVTAALGARLVRIASPGFPGLSLLGFAAIAFLPVHLYVSAMPGNKLTEVMLSSAAVVMFVGSGGGLRRSLGRDVATGVLLGLALLAAFSGLLALLAILASLIGSHWMGRESGPAARGPGSSPVARAALICGVAGVLCAPFYLRNLAEFGTPFRKSSDFPPVHAIESQQPPGQRNLTDYMSFPLATFTRPEPRSRPLLHSVWASAYLTTWSDAHRQSDVAASPAERQRELRWRSRMLLLGLVPTLVALLGAGACARDVWRGKRLETTVPVLWLAAANLSAYAVHAAYTPTWAATKAAYLLGASVSYAVFLVRGVEQLAGARGSRVLAGAAVAATLVAGGVAAAVNSEGWLLPRRADSPAAAAVFYQFGEYERARRIYGRLVTGAPYPVPWLENLAAVELAEGRFATAERFYRRAEALAQEGDPLRQSRLAVAMALAGDPEAARERLDRALAVERQPELLANRAVLRAASGDWEGARLDLDEALESEPEMVPAWLARAEVARRMGQGDRAREARASAARHACQSPRRFPYGLGTGEVLEWGVGRRWLLVLGSDAGAFRAALPDFYREVCDELSRGETG
ncbi:tetratricopeptide repeat protein [Myxococcota bacterium]|nr:tetratricopeptide repeat protein [Myxococcota bacterium]